MRRAPEIEIALTARPGKMPLQSWLYGEIRAAILSGRLAPGTRLPSTRDLAARHGLSRGTALAVFDQLAAEGYLTSAVGQGSFVAPELPDRRPKTKPVSRKPQATAAAAGSTNQPGVVLSLRGRLLARTAFPLMGRTWPARAFRPHQPDLSAFPFDLWTRIATRCSRLSHRTMLTDGEARGYRPLREAIAAHLRSARGIVCSADNVVMVGSVQQVIDLSARLLLDPGDEAWMENPGYPGARLVLEAAGAKVVGVPVDSGGMDVSAGQARAPHARLAYVTAGRQAPLGPPLALDRRLALLAWAKENGSIVIEDDYDSEYRFTGAPLAAMKSLDEWGCVIYCGTFSKLLFPALRLAYAVLPDPLIEPFTAALSLTFRHVPLTTQATLHEFIAEGHLGRHVRRMRLLYAERAQALRKGADRYFTGLLDLPAIAAGLDAPAFLPQGIDDTLVARSAAAAGIECHPLSFYAMQGQTVPGLVLGFAAIGPVEIESAARKLARVLEPICKNGGVLL